MNRKQISKTQKHHDSHHVYILPTGDRSRAKLGRTRNGAPLDRITALSNEYPEIDLARAVLVEVDSHKVEQMLHFAFAPRRAPQSGRRDGFTEWFHGDLVEEALELLQTIAERRGTTYRVMRNIDSLVRNHRLQNPECGIRPPRPTEAERDRRAALAMQLLRDGLFARAQDVVARLGERTFDAIVTGSGQHYLSRTVCRETEPECWADERTGRLSDWGRSLAALADVDIRVDGGSARWRLLDLATFLPVDHDYGREYYRLADPCPSSDSSDPLLDRSARAELWRAVSHLRTVDATSDPIWLSGPFSGCVR